MENKKVNSFNLTVIFKDEDIQVCGYLNEKGDSILRYDAIHFNGEDIKPFLSEIYLKELEQIILEEVESDV